MDATTLPTLLLGGDPQGDPDDDLRRWGTALELPVRARAGRRPGPALPARRRRRRRGRHRRRPRARWRGMSRRIGTTTPLRAPVGLGRRRRLRGRGDADGHEPGPGWSTPACASRRSRPAGTSRTTPATRRPSSCRSSAPVRVEVTEADGTTHDVELAGRAVVFDGPTDVVYAGRGLDAARHRSTGRMPVASPCAAPAATKAAEPKPFRHLAGIRGARRAARRRPGQPPGAQLRPARRARRRLAHRLRGASRPAGNWSSYPPHKHDEERPGEETELEEIYYFETRSTDPRGTDPVGYQRVYGTAEPPDRRARRGAHRRRRARARTAGTARRSPAPATTCTTSTSWPAPAPSGPGGSATTRPTPGSATPGPTSDVDPRLPVATATRMTDETVRLTVAQAVVRFLAAPVDASATASGSGSSPAASASSATATSPASARRCSQAELRPPTPASARTCPTTRPATSRRWCTPPSATPGSGTGSQTWAVHRLGRPRLDQHGHRRRARHHQPAPGAAAAPRHLRHPGQPPRCCRSSSCRTPHDVTRQRRVPAGVALLRPGRPARAAARRAARPRCGCSPTRPRPAPSRSALPQDVQAEAYDWPVELFAERVWHVRPPAARGRRASPAPSRCIRSARTAARRRRRRRHLLRRRATRCAPSPRRPASRSAETQAGKGALPDDHPQRVGAVGVDRHHGRQRARPRGRRRHRRRHPLVSDFTTASRTAFQRPRRPLRQPQRRRLRRRQARGLSRSSPTPARASTR